MDKNSLLKLYENYVDTFNFCGSNLLKAENSKIENYIFEEFDISVHTFLHVDNLNLLLENKFINSQVYIESIKLRNLVIEMQNNDLWKIEFVKNKVEWTQMFELSDRIKDLININPTAKQS